MFLHLQEAPWSTSYETFGEDLRVCRGLLP